MGFEASSRRVDGPLFEQLEPRLLLDGAQPTLVDLQLGSDTGLLSDDNVTNNSACTIDIIAGQEGDDIRVYRDGTYVSDASFVSGNRYEYTFAPGELAENDNIITARGYADGVESLDSPPLNIDLDQTNPFVAGATPSGTVEPAINHIDLTFNEALQPGPGAGALDLADLQLTGPGGAITPTGLTDQGGGAYRINFDEQLSEGAYSLLVDAAAYDVAGNNLDGNADGVGGDDYQLDFNVARPAGLVAEVEGNNTLAEATSLNLIEDPAGSGLLLGRGLGIMDPAVSSNYWSDPDYWSFWAQAGDIVSVSVDTPTSGVDPYFELKDAGDNVLASDNDDGPDNDAYFSNYTIGSSGLYYVKVGKYYYSTVTGSYKLRVDLTRGELAESDDNYNNDSIAGADYLPLESFGDHRQATVTGNIMAPQGSNTDEDIFTWSRLNVGSTVEFNVRLPGVSTLDARVTLLDADSVVIVDEDGDPTDGHFLATLADDGIYY
ncbi:MAG: LEPR-XLL domain-containing protein, partial [Phycisphaerales bacterium]|nr:LEPR-XLL domain-containing protein [Phycisphaerales bacterium]